MLLETKTKTRTEVEIEELGKRHRMTFRCLGNLGLVQEPLYMQEGNKEFYVVPRAMEKDPVPPEADMGIQILTDDGWNVVDQYVVHDVETIGSGLGIIEEPEEEQESIRERLKKAGSFIPQVLVVIGTVVRRIALILGAIFALMLTILADPALIAVVETEDGLLWVEVLNWPDTED